MSENKVLIRQCVLKYFQNGYSITEASKLLQNQFKGRISSTTCRHWYARFRAGDFDLCDKARGGRPISFDIDEFRNYIDANPKLSTIELARLFKCSKTTISRVLRSISYEKVDDNWMPRIVDAKFEPKPKSEQPEYEIIKRDLSLEQKIFIVSRYYESGRQYNKLLEEFDGKFQMETTSALEELFETVITTFESSGSVANTFEILVKQSKQTNIESDISKIKTEEEYIRDQDDPPSKTDNNSRKKRIRDVKKAPDSVFPKECPFCHKTISHNTFRIHLRIHTNEKPFACTVCDKRFRSKYGLTCHNQVHLEKDKRKINVCPRCGKQSTQRSNHNKHMKMHELEDQSISNVINSKETTLNLTT